MLGESTIAAGKQEESGIVQWFPGESTGTTPSGQEVGTPVSVDGGQEIRITALEDGGGGASDEAASHGLYRSFSYKLDAENHDATDLPQGYFRSNTDSLSTATELYFSSKDADGNTVPLASYVPNGGLMRLYAAEFEFTLYGIGNITESNETSYTIPVWAGGSSDSINPLIAEEEFYVEFQPPVEQYVFRWSTAPVYDDDWNYLPKSFVGEMRVGGGIETLGDISEIMVDDTSDAKGNVIHLWNYMYYTTSDGDSGFYAYAWMRVWDVMHPERYAIFEVGSVSSIDDDSLTGTNFRALNLSTLTFNGTFEEGALVGLEILPDQNAYRNLQNHISYGTHSGYQATSQKDQSSGYAGLTYNGWLTNSALSGPNYTMPAQSGQVKYYTDARTFASAQVLAIATRCGLSVSDIAANSTTVLTWSESFDTANLHATGSSQFKIGNNPETGADYVGIYRVYIRLGWLSPVGGTLRRLILLLDGSEVVRHETDPTGPNSAIVDYNTIDTILQLGSSSRLTVTAFQDSNTSISVEGYIYLVYMGDYPSW